ENAIIANTERLVFNIRCALLVKMHYIICHKYYINNSSLVIIIQLVRVPNGGDQYQWLYREASIVECQPDAKDVNYIVMKVIVTKSKLGKFIKHFGKSIIAQR